eukprot:TRINITY_DN17156_c0_g1_i1.p2 TRINITY_DN17156_c0_g1~~TRINITY_DN17156_c0_g1_i1.p2  ORF type:complete len:181 (+),score=60.50 TRINITY_DN17156_c0_g1_i1:108-650(+)
MRVVDVLRAYLLAIVAVVVGGVRLDEDAAGPVQWLEGTLGGMLPHGAGSREPTTAEAAAQTLLAHARSTSIADGRAPDPACPETEAAKSSKAIRKEATAVGAAAEKAAKEAQSEISHVEELSRGAAKAHEEVARKKVLEAMALEKMQMTTARVSDLKKRSTLAQQVVERAEQAAARSRRN